MDGGSTAVLIGVCLAVAAAIGVFVVARQRRDGRGWPTRGGARGDLTADATRRVVVLDLDAVDPSAPAVRRLVDEVVAAVLATDPDVPGVEVRDRSGSLIAIVEIPAVGGGDVAVDGVRGGVAGRVARAGTSDDLELRDRDPFATTGSLRDRFELPISVTDRLPPRAGLVDLVRALLEAAGRPVDVQETVLVSGDEAVVALESAGVEALNAGFLRYRSSGAARGVAVSLQEVSPREVQRRESLAPDLRYGGPAAIQRMADAVAVGADPLRFALGPPTVR